MPEYMFRVKCVRVKKNRCKKYASLCDIPSV